MQTEDCPKREREGNRGTNEDTKDNETKEAQSEAMIFNKDINTFDSKECESIENVGKCKTEAPSGLNSSQSIANLSQAGNDDENLNQELSNSSGQNISENATKDCWLCVWNIPNETSLALVIIIVACLILVLKVVLSNNVYMFVILMAVVGCFTYYQVARNIEHSN